MKQKLLILLLLSGFAAITSAQVSGTVFRDYNGNGTKGSVAPNLEPGVLGIIVNAYNGADALIASYTTATTGNYSIPGSGIYNGTPGSNTGSVPNGTAVRLEFIIPATGSCGSSIFDFSSFRGSGTSIQFVTGGAAAVNINYGINSPEDFTSSTNPSVFVPRFINGNPTGGGNAGTENWFLGFPYNNSGSATAPAQTVNGVNIGSVWGVAYSKQAQKIFTSAFVKRHVGLGTLGSGGIYLLTPTASSFTVSNFYNMDANGHRTRAASGTYGSGNSFTFSGNTSLTFNGATDALTGQPNGLGVIGTNAERVLATNVTTTSYDPAAFSQIGKVGLGDIEISADGKYLFVMNLYSRLLFRLTLNDAYNPTGVTAVDSYSLPTTVVTNGVLRPFGLKFYQNKVLVGAVASGENGGANTLGGSTDMFGFVFELQNATGTASFNTTPVIKFPLNYNKGLPWDLVAASNRWYPWSNATTNFFNVSGGANSTYPTPMLTNIEVGDNGALILAFTDRSGHQYGHQNRRDLQVTTTLTDIFIGGDLLTAGKNCGTAAYTLENNGTITSEGISLTSSAPGPGNNEGPATINGPGTGYTGTFGEFFRADDVAGAGDATISHEETTQGALAVLRGDSKVMATAMDVTVLNNGGTIKHSTLNGVATGGYQLYVSSSSTIDAYFRKGNGLGDIEFAGTEAPIEIGNRIWNDANGDGIQNPGEAALANISLELFLDANNNGIPDGAAIGAVTTDANGNYYFSSASGTDVTGVDFGVTIQFNQTYLIRVAAADWNSGTGAGTGDLAGYQITRKDKKGNGASDLSDNDAALINSIPQISVTTGTAGQNNHNLDFGFKQLASLGDKVWLDNNKDGTQQAAEPAVSGITVTLKNSGGTVVASTITDAMGNYLFDNLTAGDYTVTFTLPANYTFTNQTNTTDDNNTTGASTTGSDVNIATGQSYTVTLSNGENNRNVDAGIIFNTPAATNSLGNRVWLDTDADGTQDAGEPGVAGVTVTLYAGDGITIIATTVTDANGNYLFTNLPPNTNCIVAVSAPAGMVFTTTAGTNIGNDTDSDVEPSHFSPNFGRTAFLNTGVAGTQILTVDAGLVPQAAGTASLGDKVWNDINNNGTQDAGEPGIAGVTVNLYEDVNGDGLLTAGELTPVRSTVTNAFGYYTFNNLGVSYTPFNNNWQVEFIQPAGYNNTAVANNNSGNDATDSDITNDATDRTGFIRLKISERNSKVDAGFVQAAPAGALKLGDKVWRDDNADGQQLATEPGVPGVIVKLYQNGADGLPATADDNLINTTTTDINGAYLFVNLAASSSTATNYNVQFSNLPLGFSFTLTDAGADATDNDANSLGRTGSINLTADNLTIDAGISQGTPGGLASLGDRVWYDLNNNGIQDAGELGAASVTVNLYNDADGNGLINGAELTPVLTNTTNALGEYMFGGLNAGTYQVGFTLPAALSTYTLSAKDAGSSDALDSDGNAKNTSISGNTAGAQTSYTNLLVLATGEDKLTVDLGIVPPANTNTLGGTVWFDNDSDGLQTGNNGRVPGTVVNLYNNAGTIIATTTTDDNGDYLFVGLADGDYSVAFAAYPAGFDVTTKAATNDATGSDADVVSGRTANVTLGIANRNDRTLDAGLVSTKAALGNKVWEDIDADGIQDAGEPGIAGVTVTLWQDITNQVATAITDENGYYFFPNLNADNWQVGIDTYPAGMQLSQKDNTTGPDGDGANTWTGGGDSDINTTGGFTGKTDVFALAASQINLTVDAGLSRTAIATVGNRVWDDIDLDGLQGAGEPGIAGVLATLYNSANQPIASAVTDGNGLWLITNVPVGTGYYVIFSNKPLGNFTLQNVGGPGTGGILDTDNDSDADAGGQTGAFDVAVNTVNLKIDAGITHTEALPVKLISFTAQPAGDITVIEWKVTEQLNINSYTIEYSTNGIAYNDLQTVAATVNSNAVYKSVHNTPVKGINYYRLRVNEGNGKYSYSDIKKVLFNTDGFITVWPNPFIEKVDVTISSAVAQKAVVLVYDANGRVVKQQQALLVKGSNLLQLNSLSVLPSGNYLIKVITESGEAKHTQKLVKE